MVRGRRGEVLLGAYDSLVAAASEDKQAVVPPPPPGISCCATRPVGAATRRKPPGALSSVEERELKMLEYRLSTAQIMLFRGTVDAELADKFGSGKSQGPNSKSRLSLSKSRPNEFEMSKEEHEELQKSVQQTEVDVTSLGKDYISMEVQLAVKGFSVTLGLESDLVRAKFDQMQIRMQVRGGQTNYF
jgi:hypothetical protein